MVPRFSRKAQYIGAGILAFSMAGWGHAAAGDALLLEADPIEVSVGGTTWQVLSTAMPPDLAAAGVDNEIVLLWKDGKLGVNADEMDPVQLELRMLPSFSVAIGDRVVVPLESWSGNLRIERHGVVEEWRIESGNYQLQSGKVIAYANGRLLALLPIKVIACASARTAYGHLAVLCRRGQAPSLRCEGPQFVNSGLIAEDRPESDLVENVLARPLAAF